MNRPRLSWGLTTLVTTATALASAVPVMAQTPPPPPPAAAAPAAPAADTPPPGYWINGIHLSAQIEGGIVGNPSDPKINDGQLFTDRANQPMLNQVLLGA
jgi:hypothetical protein